MNNFEHSDYIIYADESGDHSLNDVNKLYPVFVLAFSIFSKKAYLEDVIRLIKSFKFAFWGHDLTVLHSSKLRKRMEDFQFLHDQVIRANFIESLNKAIDSSPFEVIAMAIDKRHLKETSSYPSNPYELSLEHCIEEIYQFLMDKNQQHKLTHIIIESRGKKEDDELQLAFIKIIKTHHAMQIKYPLKLIFADKKTNSIGLQIADLIAYPIGRFLINPEQNNPAFKIVEKKFHMYPNHFEKGLKIFTRIDIHKKRKTPELSEV
ncbi:MAG: DUF3800 domain-containing protein [Rhabdochlamydiaceae bacterium]